MAKENFSNFATTLLFSSTLIPSGVSFVVTTGQGALFPAANFTITIDAEVIFIASRTGDVFNSGQRGFDGTVATTHVAGATIQLCATAYSFNHLWQNAADTFNPDVPPIQIGGTPSSVDAEFEALTGSWQLFPNSGLPSGAVFSAGAPLKSHLLLKRGTSDNTLYTVYSAFTQSAPWMATCKLSHAVQQFNSSSVAEVHFFISDQTNPTSSADSGNRIRIDSIIEVDTQSASWHNFAIVNNNAHWVRMLHDTSGVGSQQGLSMPVSFGVPLYLRITCASGGNYTCLVGDGYTYWTIGSFQSSFSVQTIGMQFYANPNATSTVTQTAAVDWIRVTPFSSANQSYGA